MSEVLRNYTPAAAPHKRRGLHRNRKKLRHAILGCLAAILLWLAWTTRDSEPVTRFIPAGQTYQLYAGEIIKKRMEIAQSAVWDLLPPDNPMRGVREQLSGSLGMPDWVLNNIVYDLLHVSGTDLNSFNDLLIVTHMSRAGCLIEKCRGFVPGIDNDAAGGLNLRRLRDAGLYYAVRGRVLIISPARQTIIRALTLTAEEAAAENALDTGLHETGGGEDLCGSIQLAEDSPFGGLCESLQFAARMTSSQIRLTCQGTLRPAWRDRLAGLLEGTTPQTLIAPPEGLVSLSADFGKPLGKTMAGIAQAWPGAPAWMSSAPPESPAGAPLAMVHALLALLGPGMRFCWRGIDQNEMLPAPELLLLAGCNPDQTAEWLAALAVAASNAAPAALPTGEWAFVPQYDIPTGMLHVPFIGGPSLEPTLVVQGKELLISSSRTAAESILAQSLACETMQAQGNLYLRVRPWPALQACFESALQFAGFGLIRNHTPESFQAFAAPYLELAGRIDEIAALAAHDNGEIRLDLKLLMKQAS